MRVARLSLVQGHVNGAGVSMIITMYVMCHVRIAVHVSCYKCIDICIDMCIYLYEFALLSVHDVNGYAFSLSFIQFHR